MVLQKINHFFFHSNFFVPTYIAGALKEFSLVSNNKITLIHLSSIGVNDPYGRLSTSQIDLNINQRNYLDFNEYEFSKCCADYSIKKILDNNEKVVTFILQPSVVIEKKIKIYKESFFIFSIISI